MRDVADGQPVIDGQRYHLGPVEHGVAGSQTEERSRLRAIGLLKKCPSIRPTARIYGQDDDGWKSHLWLSIRWYEQVEEAEWPFTEPGCKPQESLSVNRFLTRSKF